ncbi:MAG: aminotransferase class IV [Planctomycetota bacterium]
MDIYLNGTFHAPENAHIRVEDAGFQHAVGLFETFQAYGGKVFRLDAHLARLAESARQLGLAADLATAPLADAVAQTIEHNAIDRARIRLTLTAGTLSLLKTSPDGQPQPQAKQTIAIVPQPPTEYDPGYFTQGVTVAVHGPAANPFDETAGHKTLNYWARLKALRHAATLGAAEAIWLNVTNHLASGCVSNVLLVKDGVLLTPFARGEEVEGALPAPVLPGITRGVVLEAAEALGIEVKRKMLSIDDLLGADEVLLTNSGWGVLPVTAVEKQTIGDGTVGAITQQLRQAWRDAIAQETGATLE